MNIVLIIVIIAISLMIIGSIICHRLSIKVPDWERTIGDTIFAIGAKIIIVIIAIIIFVLPIISLFSS